MKQSTRIIIAIIILAVLAGGMLGIEALRRSNTELEVPAGNIPIYLDSKLVGSFAPADLDKVEQASFVDAEEGKTQEGWHLRDVLLLHVAERKLKPETQIVVSSSSRNKSATLTWAEAENTDNNVLFDLANSGTIKLVSTLERLDTRAEWVQVVDKIEVNTP